MECCTFYIGCFFWDLDVWYMEWYGMWIFAHLQGDPVTLHYSSSIRMQKCISIELERADMMMQHALCRLNLQAVVYDREQRGNVPSVSSLSEMPCFFTCIFERQVASLQWLQWNLQLCDFLILLDTNNSPLKMDGWKTILSYWVSAYFQVRTVNFRDDLIPSNNQWLC